MKTPNEMTKLTIRNKIFGLRHQPTDEPTEGAQHGAQNERNEQDEADGQHHRKGQEAVFDETHDAPLGIGFNTEDGVHGVLQLGKHARRAKE